jgi:hypothetical protein
MMRSPLGVEGDLLVGGRERPGHLEAPFLAEHEAELTGWTEAVRMIGTIGCAGTGVGDRAQQVPAKEAVLARRLPTPTAPVCHSFPVPCVSKLNCVASHQSELHTTFAIPFPGKRINLRFSENGCKQREFSEAAPEGAAFSAGFSG